MEFLCAIQRQNDADNVTERDDGEKNFLQEATSS